MKKILITGYRGFIGTKLLARLEKMKKHVKFEIILVDKLDGEQCDITKIKLPKSDIIFHLAGQTDVQTSIGNPSDDALNNIMGTVKILEENQDSKIIFTSSVAMKDPQSPYGISKMACENYTQKIHKNTVVCRLPNVFAIEGQGVVSKFIEAQEVIVFGEGDQTRDFVHVDDIVGALIQAMDWGAGIYELGSENNYSIIELAKATGKTLFKKEAKPGEIMESICENTTPDWEPKINVKEFIREQCK